MKHGYIDFPEIPATGTNDLHNTEYMNNADLVLFMAGNQFMVMDELLNGFQNIYPEVEKIFYETLPPGLELKQILAGGALYKKKVIDVTPDVYTSVTEEAMKELSMKDFINDYFIYLHNRLVLMVHEGNPAGVNTVNDLGRDDITSRFHSPEPWKIFPAIFMICMKKQEGIHFSKG
jgi:ABC-type molybdate transport system substrate-binding protein